MPTRFDFTEKDVGAKIRNGADFTLSHAGSGNPTGYRHAEAGHDVDDLAGDLGPGLLCQQSSRVEADQSPCRRSIATSAERPAAVTDGALPSQATTLLDQLDVAVALSGVGFRRGASHRG